jgi:hypothetical protein
MLDRSMKKSPAGLYGGTMVAVVTLLITFLSPSVTANAQEHAQAEAGSMDAESAARLFPAKPPYSPYAGRNFPTRPLFGDTHLHTTLSFDAGMVGCLLGPEDAYRFAKGHEVASSTGQLVKLSRPLDFLAVSDHSDNLGFAPDFISGAPNILANSLGRRWYNMVKGGDVGEASNEILQAFGAGTFPEELKYKPGTPAFRSSWQRIIKAATDANDPGRFTALIGYEWTAMPSGNNIHRNVIYRDGGDRAGQMEPYTTEAPLGSDDPRDLWKWMAAYEEKTGGDVLAIAHNGNVSNGIMFPLIEPVGGRRINREYSEARARFERLYEVAQTKGYSEAHPFLSPNDEFADIEIWDKGNLDLSAVKKKEMLQYEYARSALKNGLKVEERLGVNPFKVGLIGSTDAHTGLSAVEEDSFMGKMASSEPSAHRWDHTFLKNPKTGLGIQYWETTSAGFAAVWATENTREAIFDAMERRETYGTTGSRMAVRMFGGWDFVAEDAHDRMPAKIGYTKGVPMGGDLTNGPKGVAPSFLVAAVKDPLGANLDRIQIIKGWLDKKGDTQEKVYDVVWGDAESRKMGADGKVPPVGNTVNVANASWTNTIGDVELITVWTDPDFDPALRAFYYVRVIEIPTPRWTAYDVKYYGIEMSPEVPMTTTERAYSSPIWYTPENR